MNDERKNQKRVTDVTKALQKIATAKHAKDIKILCTALLDRVSEDEFASYTPAEWAAMIYGLFLFAKTRERDTANLRVYNPDPEKHGWESEHTVVEIINDDMPFLVDSVSLAIAKQNIALHTVLHPLLCVERDVEAELQQIGAETDQKGQVESFMHLEIDRQAEAAVLKKINLAIGHALSDVRAAVDDWAAMRDKMQETAKDMRAGEPSIIDAEVRDEYADLLEWLIDDHFTYLGYREYEVARENGDEVLRAIPDTGLGILKNVSSKGAARSIKELSRQAEELKLDPEPIIVTKTNARATVHRQGYMDYIGVLRYGKNNKVIGEKRFIGLYTSSAYNQRPWEIPVVRHKVEAVMERSGLQRRAHAGKALWHILETLPRDELFQASEDELYDLSLGILGLQERQRTRLFVRRDRFGRFFSCLVFVPKERYNTELRLEIQRILKRAFKGERVDYNVELAESVLARVYLVIRPKPGEQISFDLDSLEHKLERAVRSWGDELQDILIDKLGEERGLKLSNRFISSFPAAYKEDVSPRVASYDVEQLALLEGPDDIRMSLYKPRRQRGGSLRFKVFKQGSTIPLSQALPILENMGLSLVSERPYEVRLSDSRRVWIQDFDMDAVVEQDLDLSKVRKYFQHAFEGVFRKTIENDGFNRLILAARLDSRQVAMLRAYCKFLLQARIPFSQSYMEQTLSAHPAITRRLAALFEARFSPRREKDRSKLQARLVRELEAACERVQSLDEDRILRAFLAAILATTRTNYFQDQKPETRPFLAFKFRSESLPDLPKPRPLFELFVYSPRVEAIHLRAGEVARGGLRWSDRREDFRTEVLSLMKAQHVKNTLIVPVGAKGGFVVKQLPQSGEREDLMTEVVACYREFISGLLSVTDNYEGHEITHPEQVVRHDGDDPYLVVAADKGTASFSDIANEVAQQHKFWLGDAFASGGSHGYDHKKMGITARGGWESVKRHFRELGKDIQSEVFTVAGIGDMSGDVFGNGMLLSKTIRLQAAFNHQHIFLDPDPDPEISYKERERLFGLERSTWDDYNRKLISKGGGVFARAQKRIELSQAVREWLGVDDQAMTPQALIREILKAPVELLWNGGIGTYVKAENETNADAGDRSNDPLRVDGRELRCKVVGEGGNLGLTQLGRVEYALNGGRINTDFVDNSAGVDCSDHEVNIKILLNRVMEGGEMTFEQRNKLLVEMGPKVAHLVLRNTYLQSQAISMMEAQSRYRLGELSHFIHVLERRGLLDRELEYLPEEDQLKDRRALDSGLTRPELSVLLAYSRIAIYSALLDSDVPEDKFLARELIRYFPAALRKKYKSHMEAHRLRREIIATTVTNSMVNRMGAAFAMRLREDTGAKPSDVARAYTVAREVLNARDLWNRIEALDNEVKSEVQIDMIVHLWRLLRHTTRWLLVHLQPNYQIADMVDKYQGGIQDMSAGLQKYFRDKKFKTLRNISNDLVRQSVPRELANRIGAIPALYPALDIVDVAVRQKLAVDAVMQVYFQLARSLNLHWLQNAIEALPVDRQWHAQARGALRDELYHHHRDLTAQVLAHADRNSDSDPVKPWTESHKTSVVRLKRMFTDMRSLENMDYATVSVAVKSLAQLIRTSSER